MTAQFAPLLEGPRLATPELQDAIGRAPGQLAHLLAITGRVGLTLAAGLAADSVAGNRRWPATEPTFDVFEAERGAPDTTLFIYSSGFNSCPDAPGAVYRRVAAQYGRFAVLHSANQGDGIETRNAATSKLCKEAGARDIVLIGDSMGGTKHIPLAAHLQGNENLNVRVLPVCSPHGLEAVKGSRPVMLAGLEVLDRFNIRGGPATRFLLETVGCAIDQESGASGWSRAIRHAFSKIRQPGTLSNAQVLKDATFIRHFNAAPFMEELRDVPFGYISPDNPDRDGVVATDMTLAYLQRYLANPIVHATSPQTNHADPCDFPAEYQRMVTEVLQGFDLPSADVHRATIQLAQSAAA